MEERLKRKIEDRRRNLEKWKESRNQTQKLMRQITKPPFMPVGKSTLTKFKKPRYERVLEMSMRKKSQLNSTRGNRTSRAITQSSDQITSTPFCREIPVFKPKAFRKSPAKSPVLKPKINENESNKFSISKRKSVQFKDNIVEIYPAHINASSSPIITSDTSDDLRRVSGAGRTPFSTTTSRSSSSPKQKDLSTSHKLENDTLTEMFGSTHDKEIHTPVKRRKSRSRSSFIRFSVPKRSSILPRDPYLLRSRTPKNQNLIETPLRSVDFTKYRSNILSTRKKSLKVSFGNVIVNKINSDHSSIKSPNTTIDLFKFGDENQNILQNLPQSPTTFPL